MMDVLHTKVAEPLGAVNAVQEIAVHQVAPYRVAFLGKSTAEIAADASAAQVQTALRALSTVGGANVNVSGSAGGPYSVTFVSALAGSPQPLLTTGFKNVRIRELVAGRRPTGYGLETGAVLATEEPALYQQTGTPTSPMLTPVGGSEGVTDHGALDGLEDNDHPQYLLVDDYDPPITDHGALSGLGDDDHPQYVLKDGSNFQELADGDGIGPLLCARITFDPSGNPAHRPQGNIALNPPIPDNAVVHHASYDVDVALTSATNSATVALQLQTANDLENAAIVNAGKWAVLSALCNQLWSSVPMKLTAQRQLTFVVANEDLTGGHVTVFVFFTMGA